MSRETLEEGKYVSPSGRLSIYFSDGLWHFASCEEGDTEKVWRTEDIEGGHIARFWTEFYQMAKVE